MDIALVLIQQPVPVNELFTLSQLYVVLNTTGLMAAAFWLGVQWQRIQTSEREIVSLKAQVQQQVVPITEMKTAMDNVREDVEKIMSSMDHLQRSIFMEAMRIQRSGDQRSGDQ